MLKQPMRYLRWTLDFALVYSGRRNDKTEPALDVFTDASWSPTGEKAHSGPITEWSSTSFVPESASRRNGPEACGARVVLQQCRCDSTGQSY
eukprot:5335544-Amphidinium_carterae.1